MPEPNLLSDEKGITDVDGTMWYKSQMKANIIFNNPDISSDIGYSPVSDRESMTNSAQINKAVIEYQRTRNPDKRAKILWGGKRHKGLIFSFLPMLKSYVAILATCRTRADDKHGQWLIKHIRPIYNQHPYIHIMIMEMAESKDDGSSELLHELMVIFEQCLKWWKPKSNKSGIPIDFIAYIQVHFKFYLRRWFYNFVERQGIIASNSEEITDYILPDDRIDDDADNSDRLSSSWYLGVKCHDAFKPLSPAQRQALVWKYLNGLSDKQIAERLHTPVCEVKSMIDNGEYIVRRYRN